MSARARREPEQTAISIDHGDSVEPSGMDVADAVVVEWTVRLASRQPARMWVVAAAMVLTAFAGFLFFRGSIVFTLAGPLLILTSTTEFLLPYRNTITNKYVATQCGMSRYEIAWSRVVRTIPLQGGVKLSPLAAPSRLDAFRGVTLWFGPDGSAGDRASVMDIVESRIAARKALQHV